MNPSVITWIIGISLLCGSVVLSVLFIWAIDKIREIMKTFGSLRTLQELGK